MLCHWGFNPVASSEDQVARGCGRRMAVVTLYVVSNPTSSSPGVPRRLLLSCTELAEPADTAQPASPAADVASNKNKTPVEQVKPQRKEKQPTQRVKNITVDNRVI